MKQVVPFTPSAGVLEWVNGTLPLGEYLIGRSVKERQVLLHNFLFFLSLKQLIHVVNQLSQKLLGESTRMVLYSHFYQKKPFGLEKWTMHYLPYLC